MTAPEKTLTIKVAGGLGNQLFMFYGGLHIARALGKEPVFDITTLKSVKSLHPGLSVFDLGLLEHFQLIEKADKNSLAKTFRTLAMRIFRKLNIRCLSGKTSNHFLPREIGYIDPRSIGIKTESVEAYFQSWRYFSSTGSRAELLAALIGKSSPWFEETWKDLQNERPLVLHVRRGDFLREENRSLGVLSMKYFTKIAELNPLRPIWIFSDSSPDSLAEFKKMERVTRIVVPPDQSDPLDTLLLMSKAEVLGISNSTFSLWAGILSSPSSQIYAPEKWFERRSDPIDLIPLNWHRIPSEWEKQ